MNKNKRVAEAIKNVVSTMMDRVMHNVLTKDPFVKEIHHSAKPLYAALVPDEIFKGSHFERRFVTPFGGVWEKLAQVVAQEEHGHCSIGHSVNGTVGSESLRRIQEVLNRLEHNTKGEDKTKPNWKEELDYIKKGGGVPIPVSVTCDIFIHNEETNTKYAFEIESLLPNRIEAKKSKEKILKLLAMNPIQVDFVYYALVYNPYATKKDYKWTFPMRWFNMLEDESVLIGNEFWDFIGGKGAYKIIIDEINNVGIESKGRIYREFLRKEPNELEIEFKLS